MRRTLGRLPEVAGPACPPDCWICELEARRPQATPLGLALVRLLLAGRRRRRPRRGDTGGAVPGPWPLSAWWQEVLR